MLRTASVARPSALRSVRFASTGKDIHFGLDARSKMLTGVQNLAKAVTATLGPRGRNVIIEQSYGPAKITKDGVTVAKAIDFEDPAENIGAQLVRQVANATNDIAGDGTTTSTVLAQALFTEGFKQVTQGRSPIEMKRGIDKAVDLITSELKSLAKDVSTPEELAQVATISANGDAEIGNLIASAIEKVGKQGSVTVADGKTLETELDHVDGLSIDRGYLSPYFVTDTKTQKTEFENPLIFVSKGKIGNQASMIHIIEAAAGHPFVIIAEDVDGDALGLLLLNKLQGRCKGCVVKAPGFGDNRTGMLEDISIATGAQLLDEDAGDLIQSSNDVNSRFGRAGKVTIGKDQTVILNPSGHEGDVEARITRLNEMAALSTSSYEKEKIAERIAKMTGGVAVIRVGGASDVEVGEKKDRVTDALNATRCAEEEGIVAGGGRALLSAATAVQARLPELGLNEDQLLGAKIALDSIKLPAKTIADNSGIDGSVVVHKMLNSADPAWGYDANKATYCNLYEAGIVDPVKVVRTALIDASSVSGLMMTSEAVITDEYKPSTDSK